MAASVTDLRSQVDEAHERLKEEIAPLDEFKAEAGEATGDVEAQMAATRDEPPLPPVEDLRVDGTTQLGLFEAGGKAATAATLALSGGKVALMDGRAFRKGDRIAFQGVAVVREVGQKDKVDAATGVVTDCAQTHKAVITDLIVEPAGLDGEAA